MVSRLSEVQSGPGPGLFSVDLALALHVGSGDVLALALRGSGPEGPVQGWSSPGPDPRLIFQLIFIVT